MTDRENRDEIDELVDAVVGDDGRDETADSGDLTGEADARSGDDAEGDELAQLAADMGNEELAAELEASDDPAAVLDEADEDDELETDERSERFGLYAGGVATVVMGLMLFVGPWRLFDLALDGSQVPIVVRDSAQTSIVLVAPLAILLVGLLFGGVYRVTTDERPEDYRGGIAVNVIVVQALVAAGLYALFLLSIVVRALVDLEFVAALVALVAGVVWLLFFTFFEFVALAIYVGIPAYVGVFAGDLFGALVE